MTTLGYTWILILSCISNVGFSQEVSKEKENIKYYGKEYFLVEGTSIPETEKESPYDRLPASYKEKVRPPVWDLSKNSAGISVRFSSNSTLIKVKWELLNDTKMNHMAETGIKGIDLYCKVNGSWKYVNTGRPTAKENEALLVSTLTPAMREYRLFLPLYDGVTLLEVGIDSLSRIEKPAAEKHPPIVFYGTSITQGGCASRPGMAYSNIISRKLGVDCVNFGFSGNGRMEAPIAEIMAAMQASFYVIDCVPNMSAEEITKNVAPLVEILRVKNPKTPIVFVENVKYTLSFFEEKVDNDINEKNHALRTEYDKLVRKGIGNLVYIDNKGAVGDDNEFAVDGVHFTDLGFMRFADYLIAKFKENNLRVGE
jgi:hypothetical protein